VEDTRRNPGLDVDLGEFERGERSELGGLEDHGVAAGEGGAGFPAGDLDRVVPGADARAHSQRFPARVGEVGTEVIVVTVEGGRGPGEVLDAVGPAGHVHLERLGDRLAGVEYLLAGDLVIAVPEN